MPDVSELSLAKRDLLEKYLRGDIPPTDMAPNTHPVPAQEVSDSDGPRPAVVTVQKGGARLPVFYIHIHAEGGAFYCFNLARDLGPEQPFYVLEPFKSAEMRALPSFEAMAAAYVRSLRAVQPEGPYQLVGFCGGGLIAFEMAQQLRKQGQAVEALVLIEPRAGPDWFRMIRPKLVVSSIRGLGALLRLRPEQQAGVFLLLLHLYRLLTVRVLHRATYHEMHAKGLLNLPLVPGTDLLRQNWIGLFVWSASHYRPHPYPGKLIYLWSREEPSNQRAGKWGNVTRAKTVEVCFMPGDQTTCRTTHLAALAQHLRRYLSERDAGGA